MQVSLLSSHELELKKELLKKDVTLDKICNEFNDSVDKLNKLKKEHKTLWKKNSKSGKSSQNEIQNQYNESYEELKSKIKNLTIKMEENFIDINNFKKTKNAKETKNKIKEQINVLKSQIKVEKSELKKTTVENKNEFKEKSKQIDLKYHKELEKLIQEYKVFKGTINKILLTLIFITSTVFVLITALTINYTVYYPQSNNGESYNFGAKESIIALALSGILIVMVGVISFLLLKDSSKTLPIERKNSNFTKGIVIGFITDFFDTIGIGSFAPTIVFLKAFKAVDDDKKILGILNVGHTIPVIFEAIIFIAAVKVDPYTLIVLISMAVIGSYLGAVIANKINKNIVKIVMGTLLFITAILMVLSHPMVNAFGAGGDAISLPFNEWKIYVSAFIFLILGGLMSLGIGLYAPAMAVVTLMGMNVTVAFPVMMASTAFLMPVGSIRFIQDKNYAPKVTVAITIGGVIGVISAFLAIFVGFAGNTQFVKYLLFLVIIVIFYTSIMMFYEYYKFKRQKVIKKHLDTVK